MRSILNIIACVFLLTGCNGGNGGSDSNIDEFVQEDAIDRESGFNIGQLEDNPVSITADSDFDGEEESSQQPLVNPFNNAQLSGIGFVDERGTRISAISDDLNGNEPEVFSNVSMVGVPKSPEMDKEIKFITVIYPESYEGTKGVVMMPIRPIVHTFHYVYGIKSINRIITQNLGSDTDQVFFPLPEDRSEVNFSYVLE